MWQAKGPAREPALWTLHQPALPVFAATAAMSAFTAAMGRATTTVVTGQRVLAATFVARIAYVPVTVSAFIAMKMIELLVTPTGQGSVVTVTRVIPVVDVAVESLVAVEPGTSPDKHSARKPIRPVIAIRGAVIRRIVKIPIRTWRRNTDVDRNLRRRSGCTAKNGGRREGYCQDPKFVHGNTSVELDEVHQMKSCLMGGYLRGGAWEVGVRSGKVGIRLRLWLALPRKGRIPQASAFRDPLFSWQRKPTQWRVNSPLAEAC